MATSGAGTGLGGTLRPEYNQASVKRYAGSAPINVRMILINSLLVSGCVFVILSALDSYSVALADFERVSRVVATTGSAGSMKPCGLAVPRTLYLMQALKSIASDPFVEPSEGPDVTRIRNAFCGINHVTDALRSALLTTVIPDSCCVDDAADLDTATKHYLCACDSGVTALCASSSNNRGKYGDILRRLKHAYVLAAPAFAVYADTEPNGAGTTCTRTNDPFSNTGETGGCLHETFVRLELHNAADNTMEILSSESTATVTWPSDAEMLYRLLALSVVEYFDRRENAGFCFKNANGEDPVEFCTSILTPSTTNKGRVLGTPANTGNASKQPYYSRITSSSTCGWEQGINDVSFLPAEPPKIDRKFGANYSTSPPVIAACAAQLEFGLMDQRRLFGLVDPVVAFEHRDPYFNNSFTAFLDSIGYVGMYSANVEKTQTNPQHTPYNNLKLFVAYMFAMTSAWVIAALISCGYLLAYAVVPLVKLLYVRLIRRTVTSSKTGTIVVKPAGTPEFIALTTVVVVGLWIIFVFPAAASPYPITTSCDRYLVHGGPFETTVLRAPKGLIGLVLLIMGTGLLLFLLACRRKPKRKRVIPLKPFNTAPLYIIIVGVLIAIFILSIVSGDDWARESAADQTGRDSALTEDLDELITAAIWILLMLGLLTGVLNQRSMAANAAMEVPFGGISVFALIWAGLGLTASVLAAVFAWPLFDCQDAFTANKLVCGDGTRIDVRWNYFWGCVAFGLAVGSILFVFFAAWRVLFAVPQKARGNPFGETQEQKAAKLSAATKPATAATMFENLPLLVGNGGRGKAVGPLPATAIGVVPAATVVFGTRVKNAESDPLVSSFVP